MARVCAEPGCPTICEDTRCEQHTKQKRRTEDARRPSARQRGYDSNHQRDRRDYFNAHPICEWHEGCLNRATDLDHIDGDTSNRDWSNYRAYCSHHHKVRTAQDQPGGWHAA